MNTAEEKRQETLRHTLEYIVKQINATCLDRRVKMWVTVASPLIEDVASYFKEEGFSVLCNKYDEDQYIIHISW